MSGKGEFKEGEVVGREVVRKGKVVRRREEMVIRGVVIVGKNGYQND